MTTTTKNSTVWWGCAALLCLLVLTALWLHLDRRSAQASLELRDLSQTADSLSTATATLSKQKDRAVAAAQAPATEQPRILGATDPSEGFNMFDPKLTRQPGYRDAMFQFLKADVNRSFSRLIVQLKLNDQDATQFKKLLTELRLVEFDVTDAMADAAKSPVDQKTAFKAKIAGRDVIYKEIEALLGREKYNAYQKFNQAKQFATAAEAVRSKLAITDTPLSPSQSDELQQLMAERRLHGQRQTNDLPENELLKFLSPAQIEAVHAYTRRKRAEAFVVQTMERARK